MKLLHIAVAALLCAAMMSPRTPTDAAVAQQLGGPSGLNVQEYWNGETPRYWLGNASASKLVVRMIALSKVRYANQIPSIIYDPGPVTIAPGAALDVDGSPLLGSGKIEFRTADDSVIGSLPPPNVPVGANATQAGIRLWTDLNAVGLPRKDIWFTVQTPPVVSDKGGSEITLSLNGTQPGFVVVRDSHVRGFGPVHIVSVTSPTQEVRHNKDGWYVDVRTSKSLLQTIWIRYAPTPSQTPSLALLDVSLVDLHRLLVPLPRAVYIGPTVVVPRKHTPTLSRPINRPVRGR